MWLPTATKVCFWFLPTNWCASLLQKHWKHQTGCQVTCKARRISPSARLSRNDQWRDPRGQSPCFSQKCVLPHLEPPQGALDWLLKKRSVGRDSHKVNMLRHVSTHAVWWHNAQTPLGMRQNRHGISPDILSGKYSGNLFEIHFGILSGILPDTCSVIQSGIGIKSGKETGTLSDTYWAIPSDIYSGKSSGILPGIYPSILSGILPDIHPGIPSGIPSDIGAILFGILPDLSSDNRSALNLAVEVQHRELAVEIAVGRQWRTKKRMRRKMRKRMRRKSRTALIKSNTPHLAGGVHPSGIFWLILIHVLLEKCFKHAEHVLAISRKLSREFGNAVYRLPINFPRPFPACSLVGQRALQLPAANRADKLSWKMTPKPQHCVNYPSENENALEYKGLQQSAVQWRSAMDWSHFRLFERWSNRQ